MPAGRRGARAFGFTRLWSDAAIYLGASGPRFEDLLPRVAFVPPPDAPLPDRFDLSLAESWEMLPGGVFAFLGRARVGGATLLRRIREYLARPGNGDVGVVWIPNPEAEAAAWDAAVPLHLGARRGSQAVLAADADVALRNYAIAMGAGCAIAVDGDAARLVLTGAVAVAVQSTAASCGARSTLPIVAGAVTVDVADSGLLRCTLRPRSGGSPSDADALDIGCRFYDLQDRRVRSLRYPIFDTSSAGFTLHARIDPLDPLDPGRSHLAFDAATGPVRSLYRTVEGRAVTLEPLPGSRLVFVERPDASAPGSEEWLTLVPEGPFRLAFPGRASSVERTAGGGEGRAAAREDERPRLRCGLSGVEYFTPTEQTPSASTAAEGTARGSTTLSFVPGQPAFARADGDADASVARARATPPPLDARARTSWITLSAPEEIEYWAQPDGACLYADTKRTGILTFMPVTAGRLPAGTGETPFPMPPYGGIDSTEARRYLRVESALVAARREAIYRTSAAAEAPVRALLRDVHAAGDTTTAITPQGFLATFAGSSWTRLVIARHGDERLAFHDVQDPLRAALLTGQQFVVISDPHVLRASFLEHSVAIEGWKLDPGSSGTIAIVKNCPRALGELVRELGSWTLAAPLNRSPRETQARLLEIIDDAEACRSATALAPGGATPADERKPDTPLPTGSDGYAYFLDTVVADPAWRGVLFLDVAVESSGASNELDAVLAATNPRRPLRAHHLGVERTPVAGAPLDMGESALFGLIRYREELEPASAITGVKQRLQVLDIEVLFHNSLVQSFTSRVALTVNELFGAVARQRGRPDNALILVGSYQRAAGGSAYVFARKVPTTFDLVDSALREVTIERAELAARTAGPGDRATVTAEIRFWGSFGFDELRASNGERFDLLSYDRLAFSGLALALEFQRGSPAVQKVAVDLTGVRFDMEASAARAGALADHFPAIARGLLASVQSKADTPGALGYMTVATPQLAVAALGSPWYALVFDLKLGTAGALAAHAGLVASLAFAWTPGAREAFAVGLKLPGSSGAASTIGIQGVIALGIHSIELVQQGGFALKLNAVTLTFLKKKLPPGGSIDVYLFGDAAAGAAPGALGWYGAYCKEETAAGDENPDGARSLGSGERSDVSP